MALALPQTDASRAGITTLNTDPIDAELFAGFPEARSFGQGLNGATDADGRVNMTFTSIGFPMTLTFDGWDIDTGSEIELLLNGDSVGFLGAGLNNDFQSYTFDFSIADLGTVPATTHTLTFVQTGQPTWLWGVTNVLVEDVFGDPPVALTLDTIEGGDYGQGLNGSTDDDGEVTMTFDGTGNDIRLTFDGFDVDNNGELEVLLNGVSLGTVAAGVNNGLASYGFDFAAADLEASNTVTFRQTGDPNWLWGVTNVLVSEISADPADVSLIAGETETGAYGQGFNGSSDADGRVTMEFEAGAADMKLTFQAFDVDNDEEIEVFLNGSSLGTLNEGTNNGISDHQFTLLAGALDSGTNELTFVQTGNPNWLWGVTNVLVEDYTPGGVVELEYNQLETGDYGQSFNGATAPSGSVEFSFEDRDEDVRISFKGFDVDNNAEIEVSLNGTSLGTLAAGVNNGLADYRLDIDASDLESSGNTLTFTQTGQPGWRWGVTDLLVEERGPETVVALTAGSLEGGFYGQGFNGATDEDGRVAFTFDSTDTDVRLSLDAYDLDNSSEVEVFLNGASVGTLAQGRNNEFVGRELTFLKDDVDDGENTVEFVQTGPATWRWGVTNLLLEELAMEDVPELQLGVVDTESYGQGLNGATDPDGAVSFSFAGTGEDIVLRFDGWDIDGDREMELLLNGESLGRVDAGQNQGFQEYVYVLDNADLNADNTITFRQTGDPNWLWGVTNVSIEEAPSESAVPLTLGVVDRNAYGNGFNGAVDLDGQVDFTFDGGGGDVRLRFLGYDIDSAQEVDVLLNGVSVGTLAPSGDQQTAAYELRFEDSELNTGSNTLSFVQTGEPTFIWGITEVRVDGAADIVVPNDTLYSEQWYLSAMGRFEEVWTEYTGAGIAVGIYDDGLQYTHYDLDDNYDATKHAQFAGNELDPATGTASHGTSVAGLIAAESNGVGIVGAAYDATITGFNMIDGVAGAGSSDLTAFSELMATMSDFDVVNHSWGSSPGFDNTSQAEEFFNAAFDAMFNATRDGRGELGTIIVKSAGNASANSQGDRLDAVYETITVAASNADGNTAGYSNFGANLTVTAPSSGDLLSSEVIVTTDLLGADGYDPGDYTGSNALSSFGGTSAAAPLVSSVVSLMLEANENLGWRDVHEILTMSARHSGRLVNEGPDPIIEAFFGPGNEWFFNGAENWNGGGRHFSEDFGYGVVHVNDAVRMAEVWDLFGSPQTSNNMESHFEDSSSSTFISTTLDVEFDLNNRNFDVEAVELYIEASDSNLSLTLTSPSGTVANLLSAGEAPNGELKWTFGAQAFRGEDVDGEWVLTIEDGDGLPTTIDSYSIGWFGADQSDDDVYTFTDEMFTDMFYAPASAGMNSLSDDPSRTTLSDDDGSFDWLNMAAMTGDLFVDLSQDGVSYSSGREFLTMDGTPVEGVVAGDGADTIIGAPDENEIYGMRGNDFLNGGDSIDTLHGGEGDDFFVLTPGDDVDIIADFVVGEDELGFSGFSATQFSDLDIDDDGNGNALIDFGSDGFLLLGVAPGALSSDDVQFDTMNFVSVA